MSFKFLASVWCISNSWLLNSVQSCIEHKSNLHEDLIQWVRASREFETISTPECKNRTQAHSKKNSHIGLTKKEWAKQWQIESEKGTERAPSSRLVAAMDKFSKARPNMNKPSKWAEEASKWPNTGDLTPQFVPFFVADYIFLFWPLVLSLI